MRIALATWFPRDPAAPHGGVEAVSLNLTRALAQVEGTEVHVVTFDGNISASEHTEWSGASIHRLPRPSGSLLPFACGEGRRKLHEFLHRLEPDVVHAHDTFGIMTRGLPMPRVFTIHGFIHEDTRLKNGWQNRVRAALWKREELATWSEQPHIISISPYVRERLRGIASGVIHDIENPVDPACFDVPRRAEAGRILSAAVICHRKNQQALVDAVAMLGPSSSASLRIAGPVTDTEYGARLKASIKDHRISERIGLLGRLSAHEIRNELSMATVFALCSFEEGAPMGIAEAMAAGVPIVTSNRCGMPYMVRDGESGFLVDPQNTEQIRDRIGDVLADNSLRHAFGANARAFAHDRFHPSRVSERTMRVYRAARDGR
jgi:glycosyltransferase involved in cell wall biosynthesis